MAKETIVVPDIGNFKDVAVIEVFIKPGDRIEVDAPLLTLETEKATMDVPATVAGTIEAVHVSAGGKVSAGSPIADVSVSAAATAAAAVAVPAAPLPPPPLPLPSPPPPPEAGCSRGASGAGCSGPGRPRSTRHAAADQRGRFRQRPRQPGCAQVRA
jgi:pyruvate/2-oxoglutarate dehydrogenase complex dihydrolipoamide acyltransferase (E2) component